MNNQTDNSNESLFALKVGNNAIYFGDHDYLPKWCNEDQSDVVDRVKNIIKNYLELDNVSILCGSGTSIHLGSVAIRNFPIQIEEKIKEDEELYKILLDTVKKIQSKRLHNNSDNIKDNILTDSNGWTFDIVDEILRDSQSKEIATELEAILNYLIAENYLLQHEQDSTDNKKTHVPKLIKKIKEELFNLVDVEKCKLSKEIIEKKEENGFKTQKRHAKLLRGENKYIFHEKMVKALLQRPLNLRRANIFTANYDLAFEYAFDNLGVHYIDGFSGFHKRYFKPETYNYDIYYPGSTTTGKIERIEKVVRYFKLHGSISWVNSPKRNAMNMYGIEEKPLELIDKSEEKGEIIIYPSAVKKSYTLDLPYSELFRQFSSTINQSQSVLITIGYAFADEHFNDIIFQALSNPSFTLIIVDFNGVKNKKIEEIKNLNDKRIIILQGDFFGDFLTFADEIMPNLTENDSKNDVVNTLNNLFNDKKEVSK